MTTKLAALLSALLMLMIVGAGCGDDEEPAGSDQGSGTATQAMTAADETSTGAEETSTGATGEAEDDQGSGKGDDDAGGGGDEDAAAEVAIEFLQANFEGDGDRACALANAKGKASIQAASTTSSCAEVVADTASLWRGAKTGEPDEVEVEGNRATGRVPLDAPFAVQEVTLQRQGGTWKVSDRENLQ